jgi:hypothetical protein
MIQNQQTGAGGDRFGRTTAPKIAKAIGATMVRKGSNEATLNDRRIVIKCAAPGTVSVGVSKKMLVRLDGVLAAFQQQDGSFTLISLPALDYAVAMKDTRSKGRSAGRVGIVTKSVFLSKGTRIGSVSI